jgi:outer membrane receptor protein involved in Fe transport
LLPKIGISHDLSDTQLIGLTWQRGYRSGGVNVRTRAAHDSYDPEFTSTFELAWRASWLDRRLRTSANLYHTDWKDQQRPSSTSVTTPCRWPMPPAAA